ncbi:hypothetical protein V2J09_013416 [Rumex salicifolius]
MKYDGVLSAAVSTCSVDYRLEVWAIEVTSAPATCLRRHKLFRKLVELIDRGHVYEESMYLMDDKEVESYSKEGIGRPSGDPCRCPFRFQAAWISHPRFHDFLTDKWKSREDLPVALETLKHDLRSWNKRVFGDVHERKNSLMQQMDDLQRRLARAPTDAALLLNRKIQEELDLTLEQEEMVWFQKSRQQWISCGDRNTKFFHMSTVMRRRSNRILSLKVDADRWCVDLVRLENHATQFFQINVCSYSLRGSCAHGKGWIPAPVLC